MNKYILTVLNYEKYDTFGVVLSSISTELHADKLFNLPMYIVYSVFCTTPQSFNAINSQ